jgi:hypothetical protein
MMKWGVRGDYWVRTTDKEIIGRRFVFVGIDSMWFLHIALSAFY